MIDQLAKDPLFHLGLGLLGSPNFASGVQNGLLSYGGFQQGELARQQLRQKMEDQRIARERDQAMRDAMGTPMEQMGDYAGPPRQASGLFSTDIKEREMAKLRGWGWLVVKRQGARGRVTEYGIDLERLLADTQERWGAVGPDFEHRMQGADEPAPNVVPLRPGAVPPAPDVSDGHEWSLAKAVLHAEDPANYASWVQGLERPGLEARPVRVVLLGLEAHPVRVAFQAREVVLVPCPGQPVVAGLLVEPCPLVLVPVVPCPLVLVPVVPCPQV